MITRNSDGIIIMRNTHVPKNTTLIAKIEKIMKRKYADKKYNVFGFVFPNGAVYHVENYHSFVAEKIIRVLKIDCGDLQPLHYFMKLGIVRIGFMQGAFYVESHTPLGRTAENAILDTAVGCRYKLVLVDMWSWRHGKSLKRKLEKGMTDC